MTIDGRFRFCTYQSYDGLPRHYICGRHEYCCTLGCCASTPFSFYQLWYFWLLILLIILLCSGGGWWFRWRHGNYGTRSSTPTQAGRRRHGRNNRTPRVYPHTYYTAGNGNGCNLPPGYDKDPPSYNEVISHLSQFPRPDARHIGTPNPIISEGNTAMSINGTVTQPTAPDSNLLLSVPPPTYQMVLDLKRRESTLGNEAPAEAVEERPNRISSTRSKIQNLLGKARRKNTTEDPPPPPVGSFPSAVSSSSSPSFSSASSGLFTISRESLPTLDYYAQNSNPSNYVHPPGPPRSIPSPSESSGSLSHSDYSSSFLSSPSSVSRSPSASPPPPPIPEESPPSYSQVATSSAGTSRPVTTQTLERLEDHLEVGRGGASRPCTGRSVLSRPTTSISARSLPPPDEIPRKTSLPGALVESDREEDSQNRTST